MRIAGGAPEGDQDSHDILDSKFAVLFFGTPHRGSLWANAGETASRFASALGFSVNTYNLRLLDKNSEVLQILRGDFRNHLDDGRFSVTSFQEELSFRFAKGRFYEKVCPLITGAH